MWKLRLKLIGLNALNGLLTIARRLLIVARGGLRIDPGERKRRDKKGVSMIHIIPEWLQEVVAWLNKKFPNDEDVSLTVLYGYDSVCVKPEGKTGFAVYDTKTKSVYLADPEAIERNQNLTGEESRITTIHSLLHEYRHHQQNIGGLPFGEKEAEDFARAMYKEYEAERKNWLTPIEPGRMFNGPKGELIIKSLELDDEQKLEPKGERKDTNED